MNANPEIPLQKGQPLSDADQRLKALFDAMDKNQFDFFDQAAKRIIELCTGMLGVLLAVVALGKDFPPAYLQGHPILQALVVAALALLVGALLSAVLAVWPRRYTFYEHDLSAMRREWERLFHLKARWVRGAYALFFAGMLCLAVLLAALVVGA